MKGWATFPTDWRFTLGLFSLATLLELSAWGHAQAFGPLFARNELNVEDEMLPLWAGLLAAAPLLTAVPLTPLWGILADRHSRKLLILRSHLIAAVAYALMAVSQDIWQFLAVRLLQGMAFGSQGVVISALASVAPERRTGFAVGMVQMMFQVGISVGPLLGSWLINNVGLRGMFAADSVLSLASFCLISLLFQEPKRESRRRGTIAQDLAALARIVLRTPVLRLNFALQFVYASSAMGLVAPFVPVLIYLIYQGPDVATVIGLTLGLFGGVAALTAPFAGRLGDRFGTERIVVFNMAGLGMMSAALMFARDPAQVAAIMALGAVPFGASSTTLWSHLAANTPPERRSALLGMVPLARTAGLLVAPLLGSAASALGLAAVFAVAVLFCAVGLYLSILLAQFDAPRLRP